MDEFVNKTEILNKEHESLAKELESAKSQISKLQEVERERDELISKAAITEETLNVLKAELVTEKVSCRRKSIAVVSQRKLMKYHLAG